MDETVRRNSGRGFASMSAERQKEIARKGGKAAHARGKAHEFTKEEAREAGRKGGQQVSLNRSHMAAIGRIGGQRSSRKAIKPVEPTPQAEESPQLQLQAGDEVQQRDQSPE